MYVVFVSKSKKEYNHAIGLAKNDDHYLDPPDNNDRTHTLYSNMNKIDKISF